MTNIINGHQKISYLPNDSTTPTLLELIDVPTLPTPCPPFSVVGWTGISGLPGTPQHQAALVYTTIAIALNLIQTKVTKPLEKWAAIPKLVAYPRAGNQLNAYYDRSALKFFYNLDNVTKKVVFACESSDVVSHELGHAILDALRPDLWNTASLEIFAFHEAFGDIMSVATIMEHSGAIEFMLKETNGDLRKPNLASRVAEEMGQAIYHETSGRAGKIDCLRNAVNSYTYVNPDTLPNSGAGLIKEPHSFSQVFTAAWYDCFVELYMKLISEDKLQAAVAMKKARDLALTFLLKGVLIANSVHEFYASVAKGMLAIASTEENGRWSTLIRNVFEARKITTPVSTVSHIDAFGLFDTRNLDPTIEGHKAHIKMSNSIVGHSNLIVDIPAFALGMNAIDMNNKNNVINQTVKAVEFVHSHKMVGRPEENLMFFVANGKLRRNYVCNAFCQECK